MNETPGMETVTLWPDGAPRRLHDIVKKAASDLAEVKPDGYTEDELIAMVVGMTARDPKLLLLYAEALVPATRAFLQADAEASLAAVCEAEFGEATPSMPWPWDGVPR